VLTADHGGGAPFKSTTDRMWVDYIIPFVVWSGDGHKAELYALNPQTRKTRASRTPRSAPRVCRRCATARRATSCCSCSGCRRIPARPRRQAGPGSALSGRRASLREGRLDLAQSETRRGDAPAPPPAVARRDNSASAASPLSARLQREMGARTRLGRQVESRARRLFAQSGLAHVARQRHLQPGRSAVARLPRCRRADSADAALAELSRLATLAAAPGASPACRLALREVEAALAK